ncbi:MAG: uridine kinase [Flammeovirgaceae bacterium]|nr:uridine kinase [Flammeovirgaceae bacterium]|tara:strand:- start:267 stop:878 length:612 start_codon:yes stop_codon:yes gene_type:complete
MIFGITGCSASGKSFVVKYLKDKIPSSHVSFIYQDNYYKKREDQSKDENGNYNFDLPSSFLNTELIDDLTSLKQGNKVFRKEYNFNNPKIKQETIVVYPRPIIILEGLFILSDPNIKNLIDHKIFINSKNELMLDRRIRRDSEMRGYDKSDVEYKFKNHVIPSFRKYILPEKNNADFIVENNVNGNHAAKLVHGYIKKLISID